MPVIYLGSRSMLKRAECHQRVDLGPWNDHFNCRGRAFALIPVGTFNHSMAYPLNAKLIRHSIGGHPKTTMFENPKTPRHETKIKTPKKQTARTERTLNREEPHSH